MNAGTRWKSIQAILGTVQDGVPGRNDANAYETLRTEALAELKAGGPRGGRELVGRGLRVFVEGDDLVLRNVRATCFGGSHDTQDSGETASGVSTKDPSTLGVALPRNYNGSSAAVRRALQGSPIPEGLPFKTPVEITDHSTGRTGIFPFIDLGPNLDTTHNGADLTVAAARMFRHDASATNFGMVCDVRIIGGAKYI